MKKRMILVAVGAAFACTACSHFSEAEELDRLLSITSLDVDPVTVLSDEKWAVQGSLGYNAFSYMGESGDATTVQMGLGMRLSENLTSSVGVATGTDGFGEDYAIKGTLRYGFKAPGAYAPVK